MAASSRTPPRFVPTLTEVVQLQAQAQLVDTWGAPISAMPAGAPALPVSARHGPGVLEEDLIHRVMQRIDVSLEHRLIEAIAMVVQQQTRAIVPRLREEIEGAVRQSVYEAVADELAQAVASVPVDAMPGV